MDAAWQRFCGVGVEQVNIDMNHEKSEARNTDPINALTQLMLI